MTIELGEGTLLGRYRLLRLLAKGGMGAVWVGLDERLGREVAVKVLPQMLVSDQAARQRFEREARAMARILHPNVVPVFDVGSADPATGEELPFLVMELVQGESLDTLLADGPLPVERAVTIAQQVAQALASAHAAGIVHRDLKPSNVMVGDADEVKVLDFGLARLLRDGARPPDQTLTQPGMVLGSCPYMSPEQALGEKVEPASDVFSCGSLLFEMLTGARPFVGATPVEVLQKVVRGERAPLEREGAGFPLALVAVVDKCHSRDPGRRYPSGLELARDLAAVRERLDPRSETSPTRRLASARVSALRSRRLRRFAGAAALTLAGLLAGAIAGALLGRMGMERQRPDPGRWRARQLLRVDGQLRHPAWNPNGAELAVEHLAGGKSRLLVVPQGEGRRHVIAEAAPGEIVSFPSYSPDGSALAVTVVGSDRQRLEIIPAVGGEALVTVVNAQKGVWAGPDLIVFARTGTTGSELWSLKPSTGEESRLLTASDKGEWWGALARPGGGMAVLGGPSDASSGVWVLGTGSGIDAARQWLAPGTPFAGASWSASGRSMAAVVGDRLYKLSADGARALLPSLGRLVEPAFDPTGRRLAAVRVESLNEIISVDPAGGEWTCLLCGIPDTGWGSVGPDGSLAYRRMTAGDRVLFRRSRNGRESPLLPSGETGACPAFSPEGGRVAYLQTEEGHGTNLAVAAVSGGSAVTLVRGVEPSEFPSWSPDGRFIAYAGGSPVQVWVVSAGGGKPRLLTPAGGDYPRWSPDGKWIAYVVWTDQSDPNQGTWVAPAAGGEPAWIGPYPTQLAWRRDSRVLWQLRRNGDQLELWEAAVGSWRWSRTSVLESGVPLAPHMEHLPVTVDPVSGSLVVNRRSVRSELLVFDGVNRGRW